MLVVRQELASAGPSIRLVVTVALSRNEREHAGGVAVIKAAVANVLAQHNPFCPLLPIWNSPIVLVFFALFYSAFDSMSLHSPKLG